MKKENTKHYMNRKEIVYSFDNFIMSTEERRHWYISSSSFNVTIIFTGLNKYGDVVIYEEEIGYNPDIDSSLQPEISAQSKLEIAKSRVLSISKTLGFTKGRWEVN